MTDMEQGLVDDHPEDAEDAENDTVEPGPDENDETGEGVGPDVKNDVVPEQ